ncbi:MAG: hypothetical protein A3G95_09115 [Flavobacteria bacterium RIFCSPLOWO2_12_FULL_31_7]|nr:MAG: hypothetical protein A3G95_09115 [Flavobacteria bacterium RIFCSPLOWO2_12_FULL_31_7]
MHKLFLILLVSTFSFSQEKEFTITQIDSIVKTIQPKMESSGILKKNKKTIGGFGNTTYEYKNKLIYSYYTETTKDKEFEFFHYYEFYYINEKPIFIKINIEKSNNKDYSVDAFNINLSETESTSFKEIKNPFLINLRMKLNRIIFDFINKKMPE